MIPFRLFQRWLRSLLRVRQSGSAIERDAELLMQGFGDGAYDEARTRARDERLGRIIDGSRPPIHWDNVRREIGRRTGRATPDTSTRWLENRERI